MKIKREKEKKNWNSGRHKRRHSNARIVRKTYKKALNPIKFHSWKNFMCLILFTYDIEILSCVCVWRRARATVPMSIRNSYLFEFTAIYEWKTNKNENYTEIEGDLKANTRKHSGIALLLCNGLMTSSNDLQQLLCYSNCCSKGNYILSSLLSCFPNFAL